MQRRSRSAPRRVEQQQLSREVVERVDGRLHAAGLRCEVRFDPDFVNDSIIVPLRNVDRVEPVILDFTPGALDTGALDDLVNLTLGKANQFVLRAPLCGFNR